MVTFVFDGDNPTYISHNGIDVLGDANLPDDGVISSAIEAFDPNASNIDGEVFISPNLLREDMVKAENVKLKLKSEKSKYDVEDEFTVDVVLETEEPFFIQSLELCILFNPKKLKVDDWDDGNWIRRGVNIYDGAYHKKFPFDYHLKNSVDNSNGVIEYKMGLTSDIEINSGTLASIKFKALEKVDATSIIFSFNKKRNFPITKITYLGKNYLDSSDKDNLTNIYISIK